MRSISYIGVLILLFNLPFKGLACFVFYLQDSKNVASHIKEISKDLISAVDKVNQIDSQPKTYVMDSVTQTLVQMMLNGKNFATSESKDLYKLIAFALKESPCSELPLPLSDGLSCLIQTKNKIITISRLPNDERRYSLIGVFNEEKHNPNTTSNSEQTPKTINPQIFSDIGDSPFLTFAILGRLQSSSNSKQNIQLYGPHLAFPNLRLEIEEFLESNPDICLTKVAN